MFRLVSAIFILVFSSVSFASLIPTTSAEVVKLIVIQNGSQTVTFGEDSKTIADWYTDSLFSNGNEDLQENGVLYHRILDDAKCTEKGAMVICTMTIATQEFVPAPKEETLWCQGFDSGEKIVAEFTKQDKKLVFKSAKIDLSMSGGGPCALF